MRDADDTSDEMHDASRDAQGPALSPQPGRTSDPEDEDAGSGRRWPWLLGGLAALALGAGTMATLIAAQDAPTSETPPPPLIETARVAAPGRTSLQQTGFLRPMSEVTVSSEINGRIADVADAFRRGNFVSAGEFLLRLETEQLQAAVSEAEAAIARAEAALAEARVERDRQRQLEGKGFASEARLQSAIVDTASAQANLTAARAGLVTARTRLDDAEVRAPFDALVTAATANEGDLAARGQELGRLVAAAAAEVDFGLTPADLRLLGEASRAVGGRVEIRAVSAATNPGETEPLAYGVVTRVGGSIESATRTVPLIVQIERPFEPSVVGGRALFVGELLKLKIPLDLSRRRAVAVPARALKGNDRIWRVETGAQDQSATLRGIDVEVLRRAETSVVVEGSLQPGDLVMVSDLTGAADGIAVRTAGQTEDAE
ncbi:efflux RND transporter periplasmic adaptor subunit [Loktanella sp. SALINAS62]|uniref:efflux RND transporter periplasmic adaptor subunit n=1 Tax=Loktanella sp. SALINAS62 TaxID=2706124 RepID=UPI001B8AF02A|nr:efflux RND transporter periplasmic adaptor subunit [Loktanella sp. SALINAS62]MBS1303405.1 efflux RND transporter periplasmic adaptor subunit [Loktanella sp. SALINAS62]